MNDRVVKLNAIQRKVARKMEQSKSIIPHVTTIREINLSVILKKRDELISQRNRKISFMPFIIKAVADTIKEFPILNSTFDRDTNELTYKGDINIGFAVAQGEYLIIPVIKNADKYSFTDLIDNFEGIIGKCREGKITNKDMSGGTFTITNSGAFGGEIFTPIINYPESAILGIGKIKQKPVVDKDGNILIAPMMYLCLSYDHRIINGATAVKFLGSVEQVLNDDERFTLQ